MRKNLIKMLCAFGCIIPLAGCSEQDEYLEWEQEIQSKLSNAKIKDISSYSELGYVSKKDSNSKGVNKRKGLEQTDSTSPWYLAGLIDGEVAELNTESGKSFWDMPIRSYMDLSNFISFAPKSPYSYGYYDNGEERYELYFVKENYGIMDGFSLNSYLLSKKTGKIYAINEDFIQEDGEIFHLSDYIINGKNVLYAYVMNLYGNDNGYWAYIEEENEQLAIKKSNMLNFIGDDTFFFQDKVCYDKYGNILIGDTIYGYNQKTLDPNMDGHLSYGYEPYTQTIYTYYNDSFYVLDGLEFKKYDNVIFGYRFDDSGHYFYYIDEDGAYKVGYDEEMQNVIYDDTYSIYERQEEGWEKTYYRYFDNDVNNAYDCDSYTYDNHILLIDGYINSRIAVYKQLDEYTFHSVVDDDFNIGNGYTSNISADRIIRDQFVYYITDNYELLKYDFTKDSQSAIDTEGYKIRKISQDSLGNIVVSGYDSSFAEFTGYLDENDNVTFTPTKTSNGEYDVIYMSPIN